ncbi:hypothetical protein X744_29820 [Mesorhizobium sp. LNJC372A00]|nr:hypothetical protein X745_30985 [Mesorhizobium sp. LNJC374B00]ESY52309.1 hypothetical protein X744_29820 [Mesorhizobium sp. LNJC372A00]
MAQVLHGRATAQATVSESLGMESGVIEAALIATWRRRRPAKDQQDL